MPTTHQTDDINNYKINIIKERKIEQKERKGIPPTNQVSNPESYWSSSDSWEGIHSWLYKSNQRPKAGGGA